VLYAGLDLSRKRLDFHLLDGQGATVELGAAPPDADGLRTLAARLDRHGEPISAAIESMNGARFVHDRLELDGWQVEIADAQKVKGLAPLACKTDRIDAWVLAELARCDLVPAIWLPDPLVRAERERARWRLHLVRHRSSLKQRLHAVLLAHGTPCPVSDLFGVRGRQLLTRPGLPEPWQGTIDASLRLIDELDREIGECERELRRLGAEHRYVPLLCTVPGISWVLAYTIAAELGDINRFPTPRKLAGYSGLCPRVYQSGRTIGVIAAAVALLAAFGWWERRHAEPLMRFGILRTKTVAGANVGGLILGTATFSLFLMLTLYMQQVLGYSPMKTGVAYLAVAGSAILWSGFAAQLVNRIGVKPVLVTGVVALTSGLVYFTQVSVHGTYLSDLLPGFLLVGVGLGFSFVPISIAALAGVRPAEAGLASGLFNTTQQIGGALGIAVLSTIATSRTSHALADGTALPSALVHGFTGAFVVGAGIAAVGIIAALTLIRRDELEQAPEQLEPVLDLAA
jgi:transposase